MIASDSHVMADTRRYAAFGALGVTAAVVFNAFPILLAGALGIRPPSGADLSSQVAAIIAYPVVFATFGLTFVILGPSLVVLALALHDRLCGTAPFAARIATAAGVIGGALITLQGFWPLTVAGTLARFNAQNHDAAEAAYAANVIVSNRVITTGFEMFGVFVIVVSVVGARAGLLSRLLSYLGILLGIALITSFWLPSSLALLPPVLTLVWSAWLGISLLKGEKRVSRAAVATTPARV
jgi:hypothetical protein